jgi:tetratricopeptide (TPR) repeat protein
LNLSNLERYEEAQQQFEQIIAIESRIFEPNSRIMVQNTLRLANTFRERKQYQKAISLYEAVLKTSIEKFPDNDLLKFRCMMQLANCYFDLKNWTAAAAAFKFFCSGFAMNLGKSHPSALGALGGLATLVGNPGQLENAEMLSRIAAEGMTSTAGKDSPSAIHERKNLANVLWKRGKLEESEHQFSIALESFKRSDPHYRAEKD